MEYALQVDNQSVFCKEFPVVLPSASKKFQKEVECLKKVWEYSISEFNRHDCQEAEYKKTTEYKIYERRFYILGASSSLATSGFTVVAATVLGAISSPVPSVFGSIAMFGGMWIAVLPYASGIQKCLKSAEQGRSEAVEVMGKLEKTVSLINGLGELCAAWKSVRKNPDHLELNDLSYLFETFEEVQCAEVGLITHEIDDVEKLLLFNNLYKSRKIKGKSDGILIEWENFIRYPNTLDSDIIRPIEFSAVEASKNVYSRFFNLRKSHTELQVDRKVEALRAYISKECVPMSYQMAVSSQ